MIKSLWNTQFLVDAVYWSILAGVASITVSNSTFQTERISMFFSTSSRDINLNSSTIKGGEMFSKTGNTGGGLGPGAYDTNRSTFHIKSHRVVKEKNRVNKSKRHVMETGRDSWVDGGSAKSWGGVLPNQKRKHIPGK